MTDIPRCSNCTGLILDEHITYRCVSPDCFGARGHKVFRPENVWCCNHEFAKGVPVWGRKYRRGEA